MITLDKTNQNVIVLKYDCLAQFSAWLAKRQAIADAASANPSVAALKAYEEDAPNRPAHRLLPIGVVLARCKGRKTFRTTVGDCPLCGESSGSSFGDGPQS